MIIETVRTVLPYATAAALLWLAFALANNWI